jgi:hypothetical protein
MGHRSEGGRGGDAEGGYQLMEMTLDEIGVLLMKAIRKLSVEERKRVAATLLEDLRKPVGKLGRKK